MRGHHAPTDGCVYSAARAKEEPNEHFRKTALVRFTDGYMPGFSFRKRGSPMLSSLGTASSRRKKSFFFAAASLRIRPDSPPSLAPCQFQFQFQFQFQLHCSSQAPSSLCFRAVSCQVEFVEEVQAGEIQIQRFYYPFGLGTVRKKRQQRRYYSPVGLRP